VRKVSIVIRTKNEERWIGACLKAVYEQDYPDFEVILVDNCSVDRTLDKARAYPVRLVTVEQFRPGHAINEGIRAGIGEYLVCLSGHCIPKQRNWLSKLVQHLEDPTVAGVYGRQEPLSFSSALDKRDLYITFGLDRIVQVKDSFFHNANSAIRRAVWEKFPFDETVTNIEDRVWGRAVIDAGYKIIYEPEASVFHHHGIHQDQNPERARKIVRILEEVEGYAPKRSSVEVNPHVVCLIPHRGVPRQVAGRYLLELPIRAAQASQKVSRVVVAADHPETLALAEQMGVVALERPPELSESYIGIQDVLSFALERYEQQFGVVDLVVFLEETHPFRDQGLVDRLIDHALDEGVDTALVARRESRLAWTDHGHDGRRFINDSFAPRDMRDEALMLGLLGAGCVTHPQYLREGSLIGPRIGVIESSHPFIAIEIRSASELKMLESLIAREFFGNA
jgi:rhamnosyltransferase